jgi:hypothetical protein
MGSVRVRKTRVTRSRELGLAIFKACADSRVVDVGNDHHRANVVDDNVALRGMVHHGAGELAGVPNGVLQLDRIIQSTALLAIAREGRLGRPTATHLLS